MKEILEKSVAGLALTQDELQHIFTKMLNGELEQANIAAFLTAWHIHGESGKLLATGASFLRKHAVALSISEDVRPLVDNCGTGGSGLPKFNISTTAALVAASAGVKLAKHGNRSASSRCGSADLLFEAGFPSDLPRERAIKLLQETGLTFFFAPNFHPVMKHVMPVRKSLGIRTVFNLLGPLANPIAPEIQLMGVSARKYLEPMAEALCDLGIQRALIVHSQDGLDEISPCAPTDGFYIENNGFKPFLVNPNEYGFSATLRGLRGGDAKTNLKILHSVLDGESNEASQAVIINAAAVIWLAGLAESHEEGIALSRAKLRDGSARRFFADWIDQAKAK